MKKLFLVLLILNFFIGCTDSEVTKEECKKEGKILKAKKALNFRTGKFEIKKECVNQ